MKADNEGKVGEGDAGVQAMKADNEGNQCESDEGVKAIKASEGYIEGTYQHNDECPAGCTCMTAWAERRPVTAMKASEGNQGIYIFTCEEIEESVMVAVVDALAVALTRGSMKEKTPHEKRRCMKEFQKEFRSIS